MDPIRVLALDVDGTLAARGDEVTAPTRAALHRAHASGIEVVIATGRRFRSTARVIERLGLDVAAACLGGALVKEADRRTVHATPFAQDEVRTVIRDMRAAALTFIGQRDSHTHGGADFVVDAGVPWTDPVARYVDDNAHHAEPRKDLLEQAPDDVLVIGTYAEQAPLADLADRLEAAYPGRFMTSIVPGPWSGIAYLEIASATVSKWSAIEHLVARRGLPRESVCAVGDQVNDLPMIRGSRLGVAMGNAPESVKSAADFVCGRHDEDGIVEVVERVLSMG